MRIIHLMTATHFHWFIWGLMIGEKKWRMLPSALGNLGQKREQLLVTKCCISLNEPTLVLIILNSDWGLCCVPGTRPITLNKYIASLTTTISPFVCWELYSFSIWGTWNTRFKQVMGVKVRIQRTQDVNSSHLGPKAVLQYSILLPRGGRISEERKKKKKQPEDTFLELMEIMTMSILVKGV